MNEYEWLAVLGGFFGVSPVSQCLCFRLPKGQVFGARVAKCQLDTSQDVSN